MQFFKRAQTYFSPEAHALEWVMEANGVLIKQQMNTGFSICIKIAFNFN